MSEDSINQYLYQLDKAFYAGKREGVREYAWWKDGVQYVGCGVRTLVLAIHDVDEEEKKAGEKGCVSMLHDYQNVEIVGIQVSADGNRVWVCIDGGCVLRIKGVKEPVEVQDDRITSLIEAFTKLHEE